jgi:capsid protein
VLKPAAKAAIKGGLVLYEKGKETFAEVGEVVEDIVAEAKAELDEETAAAAAPAAAAAEKGKPSK